MIFSIPVLLLTDVRALSRLVPAGGAIAAGAAMLLAANLALSGQLAWTPGGFGIAFGRMLQDGIVKRYLDDHCPDARLKLCPYRNELPTNADDFLWSYGVFNKLGRFSGLGEKCASSSCTACRSIRCDRSKPQWRPPRASLAWSRPGTGHTIRSGTPMGSSSASFREVPAMQQARQQHGELHFDLINRLHVPIALVRCSCCLCSASALVCRRFDDPARLAATAAVALLANAFVCGALSGPHDRYGARIAWIATFTVAIALLQTITSLVGERGKRTRSASFP